jgi:hypothetical protein
VSNLRPTFAATALLALAVTVQPAAQALRLEHAYAFSRSGQAPSLDDVLGRAADYVADFRRQLSGIVAEETYRQEIARIARIAGTTLDVNPIRRLRSDLLLVKPTDGDRHVELRDVFEVDGQPVRDREARLEKLLRDPQAGARIGAIIEESARYNIGAIQRNINTPLMALQFLDAANQQRFRFRHVPNPAPVFKDPRDQSINEAPVFRVATEMWTIAYEERGRDTVIRRPGGDRLPARGRFWINPTNGHVLISELIVDGGGVLATVTVSYQSEPLMGFLVPVEMRESYIGNGERISGHAEYGKFRPVQE